MKRATGISMLAIALSSLAAAPAWAQDQDAEAEAVTPSTVAPPPPASRDDDDQETIVVTGSYLPQTGGSDSAIRVINLDQIAPPATLGELFLTQPEFSGNAVLSDPGANSQTGASFINLRGLGPGATLILLNGRRQAVNSQPNTRGEYGVDTEALTPLIMLSRVEIVKEGASAIYGTDAVAGVVNFITRSRFTGIEMQAGWERTEVGDQNQFTVSGLIGGGSDRAHFVIGAEYVRRDPLNYYAYDEVVDYVSQPGTLTLSPFGNPGTYRLIPGQTYNSTVGPGPNNRTLADPLCGSSSIGTDGRQGFVTTSGANQTCASNTQLDRSIIGGEDRLTMLATGSYDVSDYLQFEAQAGFTNKHLFREGASGLNVSFAPVVPASNPGNPFGGAVTFSGRVPGSGSNIVFESVTDSFTYLGTVSAGGKLPIAGLEARDWHWDASINYSANSSDAFQQDTVRVSLQNALNGLGGPNCNVATGTPGQGNCFYYNPFANAFIAPPGSPQANNQELLDWLLPEQDRATTSSLLTWGVVFRGELFDLPGGPVGLAFGYEGRREHVTSEVDATTESGGWSFITQEFDFDATRNYNAGFFEIRVPILEQLELSGAGRYETYGEFSRFNPRLGFSATPFPWISLRGSYSRSFQAPSLRSQFGTTSSSASGIRFPGINAVSPKAIVAPNPDLRPQTSESFNAGVDLRPVERLRFSVDYYRIDFTNLVGQEAPQLLVDEYIASGGVTNADRFVFDPTGTTLITIFLRNINASSVVTSGFDFSANYTLPTAIGRFSLNAAASYIDRYDYQQTAGGVILDGVGRSNQGTSIPTLPRWRGSGLLSWTNGGHRAMFGMQYTSGLFNPALAADSPLQNRASHVTFDLRYAYTFSGENIGGPLTLRVGVVNIFDNLPPFQAGQQFYPLFAGVYDPRGRRFTFDITKSF